VELARSARQSGGLTVATISVVFTIGHVAKMLGEDEDWLHELSINMFPEDGCLWVHGVGEDGIPACTEHGIECLRQIIADERAAGTAPMPKKAE
jgi:hypothetical protein